MSSALALVALGRAGEADELLGLGRMAWEGDARYAVALAMAGAARGDLDRALAWLRDPAETAAARDGASPLLRRLRDTALTSEALTQLKRAFPDDWREHVSDTQVSSSTSTSSCGAASPRPHETTRCACPTASRRWGSLPRNGSSGRATPPSMARTCGRPRCLYDEAMDWTHPFAKRYWSIVLKLSDVAFVSGDLAAERFLRELYYGSLR